MTSSTPQYDIVISFAGEQRPYAENLAKIIRRNGFRVFYDDFEQAEIWGQELNRYFARIYGESGRYCIMFISREYKSKSYPYRERLAAINRFMNNMGASYLLPIRVDDTQIEELPSSIAYLDLRKVSIVECGEILVKKLGHQLFMIPDDLDFAHLAVSQGGSPDLRRHLKSLSAKNIVYCPTCNAPFDVTDVPLMEEILCPNCGTRFDAKSQIEEVVRKAVESRGIDRSKELGRLVTIKVMRPSKLSNTLTCCFCRKRYEVLKLSDSDREQRVNGVFIGLYNRTINKQTFLFFCKDCLSSSTLSSDVDLDDMNMYPGFYFD